MKVRYTGINAVTFADPLVGEVFPGQEFNVSEEDAAAYLTRADIEEVEEVADPFSTPIPPPAPVVETVRNEEEEPGAPEVV